MKRRKEHTIGVIPGSAAWLALALLLGWFDGVCAALAPAEDLTRVVKGLGDLHCLECHSAKQKRGGLDLTSLSRDLSLAAAESEWVYVYDRIRRDEMPPRDEPRPDEGLRETLLKDLAGVLTRHDLARRADLGRVRMRRLNRTEYDNTVQDLLSIDISLVDLLPPDSPAGGFSTVAEAQHFSAAHLAAYMEAANVALDAAIRLGPAPEPRTRRLNYLELAAVQARLARKHGAVDRYGQHFQQWYRAAGDALLLFRAEPDGLTAVRDAQAPAPGLYRVRLSAHAVQSAGHAVGLSLLACAGDARRRVASLSVNAGAAQELEATVRLERGDIIDLGPLGCGVASDGRTVEEVGAERFEGPGLAVRWIEIEGPIHTQWPPQSVARVFGDVAPTPSRSPGGPRAYEIVPRNADADLTRLIRRFAGRAFRRPVSEEETAAFVRLGREGLAQGATFEAAVRRGCLAVLTSTEFLFLHEPPGPPDDYALAARLSYFLWCTMPDGELMNLAAAGRLHEPAVLGRQAERLLTAPRSRAFVRDFCADWLDLPAINATMPDKTLYPEFDDALLASLAEEPVLYLEELLRTNLGVTALIDGDFAMLNGRLALHYGLQGVQGPGFRKVALPAGSHRGGIITQASVLKLTANGTTTSPVVRGAWVMRRLLGRPPRPPPGDAGSIEPDTRGATTVREQLAKHRRSASCSACHQYIDPAGFALENYDPIGRWRERYRAQGPGDASDPPAGGDAPTYHDGPRVDASGELADGTRFSGIKEFKAVLKRRPEELARAFVGQLAAYATGAEVTFADRTAVEAILARARPDGYGLRTLIRELIQSPLFQNR